MLGPLAFYGYSIVRNEKVEIHVAHIGKPIKGLLLLELDSIMAQEGAYLFLQMRRFAFGATDTLHMALRILPKLTMLLSVLILLVANDADFFAGVDILGFGIVVNAVVNFFRPLDEFDCIQLNVAGTHRAAVASKDVLWSHPELAMHLANHRDFLDGRGIINLREVVFVPVNRRCLLDEFFGIAGFLLASDFISTTRTADAFDVVGRLLKERSVLRTDNFDKSVGIDID